jgi:hypothetical protein
MGNVSTIAHDRFPEQGSWLGCRVRVCFHYDTSNALFGRIVRDDREKPFELIIALDNGRYVTARECQFDPVVTR